MQNDDLVAECAAVIDVPRDGPPSSFVLHAPLELLARALLLERAPDHARELGRRRLSWLADAYLAAGPAAPEGESSSLPPVDTVVSSLAAAGHAPILLMLRERVPAVARTFGDRLVATEVARTPDWALRWPSTRADDGAPRGDLAERLAAPRSPGPLGSDFIYPTMSLTEGSGLSAEVLEDPLRGLGVPDARRALLRVAAHSMLQDDADAAPYGWSHCLTMPQAVLAVTALGADPGVAIGVAATYVLGFRATKGKVALDPAFVPDAGTAAGRVWRADDDALAAITDDLVAVGLVHPDAHLAKYTLACLDAADADPDAARLFLSACAHLQEWWHAVPHPDDPILRGLGTTV